MFNSNSFNEAIQSIISLGGDTDINACIVGSIAEALYRIENELLISAKNKLPEDFVNTLNKGYEKVKKLSI